MTRHEKLWHQGMKCQYTTIKPSPSSGDVENITQPGLFQCEICPFQTKSDHHFNKHQEGHSKPSVKCLKCSHETDTRADMLKHRKTHSETKERKLYKCERCGFEPENKLKRDERRQQQMRSHSCNKLTCELCDYKSNLKSHMYKAWGAPKNSTLSHM